MVTPKIHNDPLYQLLRDEKIDDFNKKRQGQDVSVLRGGDYRGLDLRGLDADGLDFTDAYFRGADLRGIDFRNTVLEGANMTDAKISGCYFPKQLSADEIRLSVQAGTRMRYR